MRNTEYSELRIMIITTGLSPIIKSLVEKYNVVGIVRSLPRSKICHRKLNWQSRAIMLLKSAQRAICRLLNMHDMNLMEFAKYRNVKYFEMLNGCDNTFEEWVKRLRPDLIVVVSMSQLLKENIFKIPPKGTINIHRSLLPKYRGPNPMFWQFYDRDFQGGVTVHYIDEGEDTGDIIYQEKFSVPIDAKCRDMLDYAHGKVGEDVLQRSIDAIARGDNPRIAQPKDSPTRRARNVKPDENVVDWDNWSTERVFHFLRSTEGMTASLPKGFLLGQSWHVVDYSRGTMPGWVPSTLYRIHSQYYLACRDGKIHLSMSFRPTRFKGRLYEIAKSVIKT